MLVLSATPVLFMMGNVSRAVYWAVGGGVILATDVGRNGQTAITGLVADADIGLCERRVGKHRVRSRREAHEMCLEAAGWVKVYDEPSVRKLPLKGLSDVPIMTKTFGKEVHGVTAYYKRERSV